MSAEVVAIAAATGRRRRAGATVTPPAGPDRPGARPGITAQCDDELKRIERALDDVLRRLIAAEVRVSKLERRTAARV